MSDTYQIVNTEPFDLDNIFGYFDASARYQEERGYPSWRLYDKGALIRDCTQKLQFKLVCDNDMAMVFSVCFSDSVIWRTMEKGNAMYLHRIVVNPIFKGRRLFGVLLDWANQNAAERGLQFIRMDTWAENSRIIEYYQSFGFDFVEFYTTPDTKDLPSHNRKLALALLQKQVQ